MSSLPKPRASGQSPGKSKRRARKKKSSNTVPRFFGRCRACRAVRNTPRTEWGRSAPPRCVACGGMLDRHRVPSKPPYRKRPKRSSGGTSLAKFLPTSLQLPPGMSFNKWKRLGRKLRKSSEWHWGDWLLFGVGRFGAKHNAAIAATGIDYDELQNAAWVAGKVEMSLRRDSLAWFHHRAAADLPPEQRADFLDQAEIEASGGGYK